MKKKEDWLEELTTKTLVHDLRINKFNLEIHIVSKLKEPNVLEHVNFISAIAFGIEKDGDKFDENYYYLCVLDRCNEEIVALYRYILCSEAISPPNFRFSVKLSTYEFYSYSNYFFDNIAPRAIELGRSLVNKNSKFELETGKALQSVWYGLGLLIKKYYSKLKPNGKDTEIKYLLGKFSLSANNYCFDSRNLIISLFKKYFGACDNDLGWLMPRKNFEISDYNDLSMEFAGLSYKDAKIKVNLILQSRREPEPKLAYSYANLGGFKVWDPIWNQHLNCWEVGMIVDISKIKKEYIDRFVNGY